LQARAGGNRRAAPARAPSEVGNDEGPHRAKEIMERISSRQNAIVKRFRELARSSRATPATAAGHAAEVLLDGEHLVQEALACDIPIEVAAFSDRQLAI